MRRFIYLCWLGLFWVGTCVPGYSQPETDIFLFEVLSQDADDWQLGEAVNITPRAGYDNQPYFTPDGKYLLFVSADGKGQTDIYRYDITKGRTEKLTDTPTRSEYSPQLHPDGQRVTAVVVEEDSLQRLWYFAEGNTQGAVLMDQIEGVGYYAWYHDKKLGLFLIGNPVSLQVTHAKKQQLAPIATDIGRCLTPVPGQQAFSYVSDHTLLICDGRKRLDEWAGFASFYVLSVEDETAPQDYAWTSPTSIIVAGTDGLYEASLAREGKFMQIADWALLSPTRLAISPDGRWLAVVAKGTP